MSQNGSQNGPRRLPETCAQDGRQLKRPKTPLGAPQERHQTILERFSSHTGIRGLSNTPNFAHLGPWERTIIKEIDLKQLKHRIRHASGRWPGEFYFWILISFVVFFGVFLCFYVFFGIFILFLDSSRFSPSVALVFVENYCFRTIFGPFLCF